VDRQRLTGIRGIVVIASVLMAVLLPASAWSHPAYEVVQWIWDHLGGEDAFEKCRYIRFTWTYEHEGEVKSTRSHVWDRFEGDYVLEFTDSKTSAEYKVYFNVNSKRGSAFKDGAAVPETENAQLVERAYSIFINDTYWLLAPTKLRDPGARIQFVGHSRRVGDRDVKQPHEEGSRFIDLTEERAHHDHSTHDAGGDEGREDWEEDPDVSLVVLHLWFFKKVGLTPGDEYWLYVRHDGTVVGWRYVLESGQEAQWEWADERDCGMGIRLPTRRISADGSTAIVFPDVAFSETMDRHVFQPESRR
jgi:hypothetical protein